EARGVFGRKGRVVERARRVRSGGGVALCERRRAGFARLSGWQPVGNWVASAREFSSIPVTRRRYRYNEQKNRDAQFAPKNGQKPKPSGWPAYTSSAHRKGETILRGWVVFSAAPASARDVPQQAC